MSSNPFGILDSDDEAPTTRQNKAAKADKTAPKAKPAEEKQAVEPTEESRANRGRGERGRGERGGRRGGRGGRGGRRTGERSPREGEASGEQAQAHGQKHGGFDRRSGTGRGKEMKKQGGGGHNWGTEQEQLAAEVAEAHETEAPVNEARPEEAEAAEQQQPEAVPEPEAPPVYTYEEYLAKKNEQSKANEFLAAKQEKTVDASEYEGLVVQSKADEDDELVSKGGKKKGSQRSTKAVKLDVDIHHTPVERGGRGREREGRGEGRRGGRGRGAGRGAARGAGRGAVDISNAQEFPSL